MCPQHTLNIYQTINTHVYYNIYIQFPLPHSRGSSHGQSRITRKAYGAKDFYTQMMSEAFSMIDELQNECGEQLFM
jgi:hypothetical protein